MRSTRSTAARPAGIVDPIRQDVAKRVGEAIWTTAADPDAEGEDDDSTAG
jgi:hypothetical protein